jgi:hypothetical protein
MAMVHLSPCFVSLVLRSSQPLPAFPYQPFPLPIGPLSTSPQIFLALFPDKVYFPGAHIG